MSNPFWGLGMYFTHCIAIWTIAICFTSLRFSSNFSTRHKKVSELSVLLLHFNPTGKLCCIFTCLITISLQSSLCVCICVCWLHWDLTLSSKLPFLSMQRNGRGHTIQHHCRESTCTTGAIRYSKGEGLSSTGQPPLPHHMGWMK